MRRWSRVLVWGFLALPASCLGGQTGQPTSTECADKRSLKANEEWGQRMVAERARAFEGHYSAKLQWFEEQRGNPNQTPVALDDTIVIDVTYEGAAAHLICGALYIPMHVDARTTASGFHESGLGQVLITSPTTVSGSLDLQGTRATVFFQLGEPAGGASPSGTVVPIEGGVPGGWAQFAGP